MYAPNNRALKYVRQNLIKLQGEMDKSTTIVGDFNTPLSVIERYSRQKISKDIIELNSTINQLDLIDIYKTLHPTTAEHTFFLSSRGTFTKIDNILAHKHMLTNLKE